MSIFYYTVGSAVRAKVNGSVALHEPIATKRGYVISFSNDESINEEAQLDELFFDGMHVKRKPPSPSTDAKWDESSASWVEDIREIKDRQRTLINASRVAANGTSFEFAGKSISCDQNSRSDIDAINGLILLGSGFPAGFANEWKAIDNTFVEIPDLTTWTAFYGAMAALGIANFQKAQAKKAAIDAAATIAAVKSITWDSIE